MSALIHLSQVWKTFRSGRFEVHALRGIDLEIAHGEFVAIMGRSGAGKTTLMDILGCLARPTSGRYRLNGRAVEEIDGEGLARLRGREIGFVFQSFDLLPRMTAVENVELPLVYSRVPRGERRERAERVLARVGLGERADHRPAELSGGERQRVAIARALVNRPSLLLADEPTGNLDSRTGGEIMRLLGDLHAEGNTLVVVTHDRAIGAAAERCVELGDGRIESDSRPPPAAEAGAREAAAP
jgi:putative ABC transport system ATP-binding protein